MTEAFHVQQFSKFPLSLQQTPLKHFSGSTNFLQYPHNKLSPQFSKFLHDHVSHFTEGVITVRRELACFLCPCNIVEVRPVCEVVDSVLVALYCGTVVISGVPQLMGLEPVRGDPRGVAGLDIKLHQWRSISSVLMFVEDFHRYPAVQDSDNRVGVPVTVNWTSMVLGPYLQNVRDTG